MLVPRDQTITYLLYALENITKVPNKFLFLKDIFEERNIGVDSSLLYVMTLSDDYEKIKIIYNNDLQFKEYLKALKKSLIRNEKPSFEGFPRPFRSFYRSLKDIELEFSRNLLISEAIRNSDISKDIKILIKKYVDFEFEGFKDIEISIESIRNIAQLDSKTIVCTSENDIFLINSKNGNIIRTLQGHTNTVDRLIISRNTIISGSEDRTIKFWNPQTGQCIRTINVNQTIHHLLLLMGDSIVIGFERDVEIPDIGVILPGVKRIEKILALDENRLLVAYSDESIIIWDTLNTEKIKQIDDYDLTRVIILGNKLIYGNNVGQIRIHNLKSLELEKTLHNDLHTRGRTAINDIGVLDDKTIVTIKAQGLEIWDITQDTPIVINTEIKGYHAYVNNISKDIIATDYEAEVLDVEGNHKFSWNTQGTIRLILQDGRIVVTNQENLSIWK